MNKAKHIQLSIYNELSGISAWAGYLVRACDGAIIKQFDAAVFSRILMRLSKLAAR